jgi:hypothetical protein
MHEQIDAFLKTQGFMTRVATTPRRAESLANAPLPTSKAPVVDRRMPPWIPIAGAFAAGFLLCWILVRAGVL